MEIGSLRKIAWSENQAGFPCIMLEFQPLSASSPLARGVLNPRRHLLMQLLYGFDLRRMWERFNSRKQPVQGSYQFPKWGFAFFPVLEGHVSRSTDPIDEVVGHALSLVRFHPTLPLASVELGTTYRLNRSVIQDPTRPRTARPPVERAQFPATYADHNTEGSRRNRRLIAPLFPSRELILIEGIPVAAVDWPILGRQPARAHSGGGENSLPQ